MLSLRRFQIASIAVAVFVLVLPARAAEVDKFLPADTEIVVVVNARQLLDSPLVKKHVLNHVHEFIESNDQITEILDDLEFDPFADLKSITAALTMVGTEAKGLIIIHGEFDEAKFADKAKEVANQKGDILKIHKDDECTIYEVNIDGGGKPLFVGIVDENTIVAGPEKQYVLDAFAKALDKKDSAVSREIQELIEKANTKQSIWFAATANAFLQGDLSHDEKARKNLEKVSGITAGITIGRDLKVAFTIAAHSADSAKELDREIKTALEQAKAFLPLLAEQNKELAPAIDAVASLRVNTDGSTVTIKGEVSEELIEKSLKKN
jgi:hypothetical protein